MSLLLTFGFPLAPVNDSLMQRYVLCGAVSAPVDAHIVMRCVFIRVGQSCMVRIGPPPCRKEDTISRDNSFEKGERFNSIQVADLQTRAWRRSCQLWDR